MPAQSGITLAYGFSLAKHSTRKALIQYRVVHFIMLHVLTACCSNSFGWTTPQSSEYTLHFMYVRMS